MTAFKGLGTYGNAVGVVTPSDHKQADAGLLAKASGNLIRPGLFWGGSGTIVTGAASMAYNIAAYTCATSRGATSGAVLGGNDGTLNLTKDVTGANIVAPGSNSAYHVVFHWHREYSIDGVDSNPVIAVIQGTSAASPSVPSLSAYPGAIALATILVPAGVTATNTGTTITQTAPFTATGGGVLIFRNDSERTGSTVGEGQRAYQLDTHREWVNLNTGWVLASAVDDTGWIAATLLNSWVNFGGVYQNAMYRRLNGLVLLKGLIKSGTVTSGTSLLNLPAGFRPTAQDQYPAVSNNVFAPVEVKANGDVITGAGVNASSLSLAGVKFVAEQ